MKMIRTRIAPSPTGFAHIGTAYYAIYNYAFAKQNNGTFIVRIEDTDRNRFVEGSEQVILDALRWLHIPYDEGPDIGGPHSPYRQSERLPLYKKFAEELIEKKLAYYCFCTQERLDQIRKEMQERKETPRYDQLCLKLPIDESLKRVKAGEKHVIRMIIPENEKISWNDLVRGKVEFDSRVIDHQVILKTDGFPTYHLAVVIDDHAMNITHVMRGEEWISSAPKHILLYRYFGWELPEFAHMPLLRNTDKSKMSKRKNDVSIFSYKERGYLPEALVNYLSLMGWSHPQEKDLFTMDEYIKVFSITRMQKTGPVFDIQKLTWMNQQYIQSLSLTDLKNRLKDFFPYLKTEDTLLEELLPLLHERMQTLKDFEELAIHFFTEPVITLRNETENKIAIKLKTLFNDISNWNKNDLLNCLREVLREYSIKMPVLYYIFTGKDKGLPLPESLEILGKEKTLKRLSKVNI